MIEPGRTPGEQFNDAVAERFAENLRAERARAKLSQDKLAARAAVHRTQISLMESGRRLPRLDTLIKLAGALGVGVEILTHGMFYEPTTVTPGRLVVGDGGHEDD